MGYGKRFHGSNHAMLLMVFLLCQLMENRRNVDITKHKKHVDLLFKYHHSAK